METPCKGSEQGKLEARGRSAEGREYLEESGASLNTHFLFTIPSSVP